MVPTEFFHSFLLDNLNTLSIFKSLCAKFTVHPSSLKNGPCLPYTMAGSITYRTGLEVLPQLPLLAAISLISVAIRQSML